jgi:preprotein translocase subunit YajC
MFITEAYAQTAGDAGAGAGMLFQLMPFVLIFVVFYFLLIRPQQKRAREQRAMLDAIRRGDRIVTGGGILGTVEKAEDNEITVTIADNVKIKVLRGTIQQVLSKPEPATKSGGGSAPAAKTEGAVEKPAVGIGRFFGKR